MLVFHPSLLHLLSFHVSPANSIDACYPGLKWPAQGNQSSAGEASIIELNSHQLPRVRSLIVSNRCLVVLTSLSSLVLVKKSHVLEKTLSIQGNQRRKKLVQRGSRVLVNSLYQSEACIGIRRRGHNPTPFILFDGKQCEAADS